MKTKLITIHLPQFHTIPENDEWWGTGFTEWTNVRRGRPFYPGHYQPRVPYDYYDLSDLKVLEYQIDLAQKAGIYGFGFYHYYFTGKTLLEKPIESYRDCSKKNFPYCLIWANQSWSRTWYRANLGKQMLLEQVYGDKEDWMNHFYYLLPFFKDDRYIKIDNKPIYAIYLPQDIPCRKEMFALWDKMAKSEGFHGIYLIAMNTGWGFDKHKHFYDAYMNFEPIHTISTDESWRKQIQYVKKEHMDCINKKETCFKNWCWTQNTYSYPYICRQIEEQSQFCSHKMFFGATAGWDNTARKDEEGFVLSRNTPKRFGKHIERMLINSEKAGNEFLFLNAWNEWSEGAYIEPDQKYGEKYLQELERAIKRYESN